MGLDFNGIRFLLYAQRLGVDFEQTAMIGRQSLDLTRAELRDSIRVFGHPVEKNAVDQIFEKEHGFADEFLKYLGAKSVHSFDVSAYEGATHLHDMNQEIPAEIKEQYSVVLDGGSLEHVFNFPAAIKNCMEMLKIGGHYLGIVPANNFMGHGFYQFSPELFFSVFTRENGFKLVSLIAFEDAPQTIWYSVRSPMEVKGRVPLINDQPVYLLIIAKRIVKASIFEATPQQSDYLAAWNREGKSDQKPALTKLIQYTPLLNWIKRNLPFPLRHLLKSFVESSGFNPRFYLPIDPTKS